MIQLNLKTRINAIPKLSPSILKDYVTKESLDETLENYVEEAPVDSNAYARKDEKWVPVKSSSLLVPKMIFYGSNTQLQLDDESEILNLQNSSIIPADGKSYIVNYNQKEEGYLWIVCTEPVASIVWGAMGMIADYETQKAIISSSNPNVYYYCYRIKEMLIPNQWVFLVNL